MGKPCLDERSTAHAQPCDRRQKHSKLCLYPSCTAAGPLASRVERCISTSIVARPSCRLRSDSDTLTLSAMLQQLKSASKAPWAHLHRKLASCTLLLSCDMAARVVRQQGKGSSSS